MIGHDRMNVCFEIGQHGKPDFDSFMISLKKNFVIRKTVIIQEKSRGDIECHENINAVVFMSAQNEKQTKYV
jgi:hypothetical protein